MSDTIKTGHRVIFADGTTFENATAGESSGRLTIFMNNCMSMEEAVVFFFDEEKTSEITFEYGEMTDVYENYTHPVMFSEDNTENITVTLRKSIEL